MGTGNVTLQQALQYNTVDEAKAAAEREAAAVAAENARQAEAAKQAELARQQEQQHLQAQQAVEQQRQNQLQQAQRRDQQIRGQAPVLLESTDILAEIQRRGQRIRTPNIVQQYGAPSLDLDVRACKKAAANRPGIIVSSSYSSVICSSEQDIFRETQDVYSNITPVGSVPSFALNSVTTLVGTKEVKRYEYNEDAHYKTYVVASCFDTIPCSGIDKERETVSNYVTEHHYIDASQPPANFALIQYNFQYMAPSGQRATCELAANTDRVYLGDTYRYTCDKPENAPDLKSAVEAIRTYLGLPNNNLWNLN